MKEDMKDILISHFDKDALKNDAEEKINVYGSKDNNKFLRAPYEYIEDNLLNDIENKKILDYCCGTGLYSILPAVRKAHIFGIDFSEKSIEIAKQRAELFDVNNNCNFTVGDAEELDFEDNFFDLVLSYGSLSYLNLEKSFKELKRVLKPSGKVIVVDSLGYNPLINHNRKRNIKNYASDYVDELKTITHKDLNICLKYFSSYNIKYFDLLTLFGSLLSRKSGYKIQPSRLVKIDNYLLKIPILNRLAFKFVCEISVE
tara:strand:- start:571 stop:1344 length:774 start_codon:yes stop_codon:yes gene_type:complete